jgi:hypothetical protein
MLLRIIEVTWVPKGFITNAAKKTGFQAALIPGGQFYKFGMFSFFF